VTTPGTVFRSARLLLNGVAGLLNSPAEDGVSIVAPQPVGTVVAWQRAVRQKAAVRGDRGDAVPACFTPSVRLHGGPVAND